MIEVSWDSSAVGELLSAKAWYRARDEELGEKFSSEIVAAMVRVRNRPTGRPEFEPGVRKARVRRFPYDLIYRLNDGRVEVLVLAHHSRKPGYWRKRLTG